MVNRIELASGEISALLRDPRRTLEIAVNGTRGRASVAIPDYAGRIERHYREIAPAGIEALSGGAAILFDITHFGLLIEFQAPIELHMHDEHMVLEDGVKELVRKFGTLIIRNVYLDVRARGQCHRNIFPHLKFHYDRGPNQPNQYSLFSRDPFDPVQVPPRRSSTLFIANIVAHLQGIKESQPAVMASRGMRASYEIFGGEPMDRVLSEIILEQPWCAPAGTGEICVLDNRTVLHASYHPDPSGKGYRIGARYLI